MKRALIITYYWPPSGGSGVQRWVKFSKYLPSLGWQPVIYTPENPELIAVDNTLGEDVPQEVEVIRRPIFEPYDVYRKLLGKKNRQEEVNPINSSKKGLGKRLAMFVRGNLFIPDPRCMWICPSAGFLKKYLKAHPVDIIISTGPPHSMHLIARKVALSTGIPWIADFRDPWTRMFYFKHLSLTPCSRRKHVRLEKKVLDCATAVVSVSPLVRDEFAGMTATPVELITNGFDQENIFREETGFFDVTHTGLFASDGNPDVLWTVLADLCGRDSLFKQKLRIRLAGKTDPQIIASVKQAGLSENLCDLGYQPHKQAVQEQKNASLLILPLRKEPEYRAVLPGKLFEYLASGVAILGIGQKDGAMASIVRETRTGDVCDWNEADAMSAFVQKCWTAFKEGKVLFEGGDIGAYSRTETAKAMAALMDRLVSK